MADILASLGLDASALGGMDFANIDINAIASGDLSAITGALGNMDMGSIFASLTGAPAAPKFQCPEGLTPEECNEAAAADALKKKQEADAKFKEEVQNLPSSSTGLECSMDGFADMAIKLVENILLVVSLLKETLAYLVPAELAEPLELMWKGVVGSSSWMGFAGFALYGVGLDYGFATEVCEAFGYGYYVIDGMNYIIAFANPEGGEVSADALLAAASGALGDAGLGDIAGALGLGGEAAPAEGEAAPAEGEAAAPAEGEAAAPAEGEAAAPAEGEASG